MSQIDTEAIGMRFHRPAAPSLVACAATRHPIVFSHVVSEVAMPGRTLAPPVEDAFAIHVHHSAVRKANTWLEERHQVLPPVDPGGIVIFDLRTQPTAQIHEGFAFSRFHLTRTTIDDLAYEQNMRKVGDLASPAGHHDPVIHHLALAMVRRIETLGEEQDTLFKDGIALAFFAHVAPLYGGGVAGRTSTGALAPWQFRRVCEWIDSNLHKGMAIADLARVLDLSNSYFGRAFTKSAGMPPHRWVLHRRVFRAKHMLVSTKRSLSEISAACGFVDQSHFTRTFSAFEADTPARWRRTHRQ